MFGLSEKNLICIREGIKTFAEIERAVVFGSRAMGNYKRGSDIDIAIAGKNVTGETVAKLSEYLNEVAPLPYYVDVVDYNEISNEELRKHIDTKGIELNINSEG
ncbi:nucleotidyltransferase family protein [Dethiobacter alkaliphilus]|uniref:nucleotidyltransferase family protein n=1 Tax=Dethiobacter alkaliphilus TaxID=427926 RepID=UPI00222709AD|nr:nucleotidyltransferase domain-containing protein [Dethiobacter alkaliphilus]MCW3488812.1 nucleotidyltransferase domain-containing protein [Dethiobacter alkaliphilus]